jgi:rubredoxin
MMSNQPKKKTGPIMKLRDLIKFVHDAKVKGMDRDTEIFIGNLNHDEQGSVNAVSPVICIADCTNEDVLSCLVFIAPDTKDFKWNIKKPDAKESQSKKTEDIMDDVYCPVCGKETKQKFTSTGHERDSSQDMQECLECGAYDIGGNGWHRKNGVSIP